MDHLNNQKEAPVSYPPTTTSYPQATYVNAPPIVEYPIKDDGPASYPQQSAPYQTTSLGMVKDGFWKRCGATFCCCCFLDCCYIEDKNICGLVLKCCCTYPMYS